MWIHTLVTFDGLPFLHYPLHKVNYHILSIHHVVKHGKPKSESAPVDRYVAKRVPLDVQSFTGNHVGGHRFPISQ